MIPESEVRAQLERVLASPVFSHAERPSRFLRYVVEKTLAGEVSGLKEYAIGVDVYGRPPGFDPRSDSIVRVEAGRLRAKLREYYDLYGEADPVRIVLPKGTYVPAFARGGQDGAAPAVSSRPWSRWWLLAAVLVVVSTLVVLWQRRAVTTAPPEVKSIAVLPFMNLSGTPETEGFADGLTEEIIARLAQTPDLKVPARTTMFQYKARSVDLRALGSELKVDAVLEGSVRCDSGRCRVTAELIWAKDGFHLWAETYEEPAKDLLAVQERMSGVIAEDLVRRARGLESWRGRGYRTPHPAALAAYVEGSRLFRRDRLRGQSSEGLHPDHQRAIELLEEAVALDPEFAEAWAALADACEFAISLDRQRGPMLEARADEASRRALRLDDSLALAHAVQGSLRFYRRWDFAGAENAFRRAVEIHPREARWQSHLADLLLIQGRMAEAAVQLDRAIMLEPRAGGLLTQKALLLHHRGLYEEAIRLAQNAEALDPGVVLPIWVQGLCQEQLGQWAEAERSFRRALELAPYDVRAVTALGHLFGQSGRPEEAEAILTRLKSWDEVAGKSYPIALVCVGLGRYDEALSWLEKAYEERDPSFPYLGIEARLAPLRSHPKAQELLHRLHPGLKWEFSPSVENRGP
ncbi:MAG: hypothetical protein Kow001_01560 [Acidobacteriota bacterium]